MNYCFKIVVLLFVIIFVSCGRSKNNAIFTKYSSTSELYKQELLKQMKERDIKDITFFFNKSLRVGGNDYIELIFKAKGMEAKGLVLVKNWGKIEPLKKSPGYRGAELKNLKLELIETKISSFLYKDINRIID